MLAEGLLDVNLGLQDGRGLTALKNVVVAPEKLLIHASSRHRRRWQVLAIVSFLIHIEA